MWCSQSSWISLALGSDTTGRTWAEGVSPAKPDTPPRAVLHWPNTGDWADTHPSFFYFQQVLIGYLPHARFMLRTRFLSPRSQGADSLLGKQRETMWVITPCDDSWLRRLQYPQEEETSLLFPQTSSLFRWGIWESPFKPVLKKNRLIKVKGDDWNFNLPGSLSYSQRQYLCHHHDHNHQQ